jgi:fibronectin-binding autotransporter adhesin
MVSSASLSTDSASTFIATGNISGVHGGLLAVGTTGADVTIGNTSGITRIENNLAGFDSLGAVVATNYNGGAIYMNSGARLTINGSAVTLSGNTSTGSGGAIWSNGSIMSFNGPLIVDNNVSLGDPLVDGARAIGGGGAIYQRNSNVTINGALSATGNYSSQAGGFLYLTARGDFNAFADVTLKNNSANGVANSGSTSTGGENYAPNVGGAVAVLNGDMFLSTNAGANFLASGNTATGNGGALLAGGLTFGRVTIGNATGTTILTNNRADGNGGAIRARGVTLDGSRIELTQNKAGGGGAIYSLGPVTFSSDAKLTDNIATFDGGAIFMVVTTATTVTGKTLTLSDNEAGRNGGGLYSFGDLTLATDTLIATGNSAGTSGGVVYVGNGGLELLDGSAQLRNNVAAAGGGALFVTGALNLATQSGKVEFIGNYTNGAGGSGGAIRGSAAIALGNAADTVSIINNRAGYTGTGAGDTGVGTSSDGGGIYASSATGLTTLTGSQITISRNMATRSGGGIYANGGLVTNGPVTLSDNAAGTSGGGIWSAGTLTISDSFSATNNLAGTSGGAIYSSTGNVSLNAASGNITFQGNRQGVTFTDGIPDAGTGTPNAIFLGAAGTLNLDATTGRQIEFFDPVATPANVTVTVNKTGAGDVVFYGDSGQSTSYDSNIRANTTVSAGRFVLADSAGYGVTAAGAFRVQDGAELVGIRSGILRANTITLETGSTTKVAGGTLTLTAPAATSIAAQDGSILAGSGTLAATNNINLAGTVLAEVDAGDTLNISGRLANTGGLTVQGGGTVVLSNAGNSYTGATRVVSGSTLIGGVANAFATSGEVIVNGMLDMSGNNLDQTARNLSGSGSILLGTATLTATGALSTKYAGTIEGTGALVKEGIGTLMLTGVNTYSGGTRVTAGTLGVDSASTTSLTNLGSGTVNISGGGTVRTWTSGAFSFDNALTGTGLLSASNSGGAFSFGSAPAGSGFMGTVELLKNTFRLAGNNTAALTSATLVVGDSAVVTVGVEDTPSVETISGLTINGGKLVFNGRIPADIISPSSLVTTGVLDLSHAGTIQVTVPDEFENLAPVPDNGVALLEQDDAPVLSRLIEARGDVVGTGGALVLVDQNDELITNNTTVDIAQNGMTVAQGVYDFHLTSASNGGDPDGLYVAYGLTQVRLDSTGVNALVLTPAAGATGLATDLSAKLTGAGDLAIAAGTGGTVSLSNTLNDYTGATVVRNGTLLGRAADVIASSSSLTLADSAGFSTGGFNQHVNNLGSTGASSTAAILGTDTLTLYNDATSLFAGAFTGTGLLNQAGGTLLLTGNSDAFAGTTEVTAGRLRVDGVLGSTTSALRVLSGATLGGRGVIGGDVTIEDGGILAPAAAASVPGGNTLLINGDLVLNSGSILNYRFGQADTEGGPLNDLTVVGRNLTLDGTLNVTEMPGGTFGPGVYRVFNYGGTLIDNELLLGNLPGNFGHMVQTSVSGQVNLAVTEKGGTQGRYTFWDGVAGPYGNGVINGGNGVWQSGEGNTNWTDAAGDSIGAWDDGRFAVFQAVPGTVSVDNSLGRVTISGMQFAANGYRIMGDSLTLVGDSVEIRVGDVSGQDAAYLATISSRLVGDSKLEKTGRGTLVLSGANGYTGATTVRAGTLRMGAADRLPQTTSVTVGSAGTLDLAGFNQTISGLSNSGLVTFGTDTTRTPGVKLTVKGNYVGTGTIEMNTVLGDDNSATDKLVINGGSASGSTVLRFTNVGGQGAQTVNGIQVVETTNGGTTTPTAFSLGSRRYTAGAYEYLLERTGQDWFLTSERRGDPGDPILRPETPDYGPVPAMGRALGLVTVRNLHERVGEEENLRGQAENRSLLNGLWGRVLGERQTNSFTGAGDPSVDGNLWASQLGLDLYRHTTAGGSRNHLGVAGSYSSFTSTSVRGDARDSTDIEVGELKLTGPSAAVFLTHFGPSGWYLDAVGQMSWYDVTGATLAGSQLKTKLDGVTASVEIGKPVRIGVNGMWLIEPQAQLIWQGSDVTDANDGRSDISWNEADAWTGRLGVRVQQSCKCGEGPLWQRYGRINLWHGFAGADEISFDGEDPVGMRFGGTAVEGGLGMTAKLGRLTSLYGEALYRHSVGGGGAREQTGVFGTFGLRLNW